MTTDTLENLAKTYATQMRALQDALSIKMKEAFVTFFDNNPDVAALAWTQYTPYFNDGDECIFGVNDIYPATAEQLEQLREGEIGLYDLDEWPRTEFSKKAEAFAKILRSVDDTIFKATFGDHVRVIATRDGFDIEEFDHD